MGSTHNVSLHLSSHTAMAMQGQEEEIKVRVRYHVKERKKWTVPSVHGEAISFVVLERVVSNSQADFSPSINNLLSPEASASFILHTLSLMDNIPRVSVRDLTTPIAKHAFNKARNALERGCNTLLLTFTMEIIEEQLLPDRGELENLNEQTAGIGVVPATDDEIAALKTNIFKKVDNKYLDCNICLEEFVEDTQVKQMPCLHVFHGPCVVEWLKLSNSCPICRSSLQHVS
ncbi:E3 ubiquitin-protein ligase RNF130-like protein [Cinnamomum micranthum f. kanehirae]|uniref:E3 ubiquitin-protein ligase RNF130-like protein n=1 Tax=Cinnamomum micranthum f. kanehirae TaxID=337451 RepID=A0A443NLG6_9MAGN|nr:E3 ubiquitin-protein ligase RNF130-like protein [Cinnamomum micranthum f. kanehirae]